MSRGVIIAIVSVFFVASLVTVGLVAAADAPGGGAPVLKGQTVKTLKGRVWSQWADNPEHEILFGIQYWNTGEPASGNPAGRASSDLDVRPPDPLFSCCAWGFVGGTEKNNPYSGWYHAQTTVRLQVKDKALMDQIIKASQDLVALEVTLDGRTVTGFKVLKKD
ncbi:MAG: hypothetical protein AB1411_08930 [Nitrospirota bacterium]